MPDKKDILLLKEVLDREILSAYLIPALSIHLINKIQIIN